MQAPVEVRLMARRMAASYVSIDGRACESCGATGNLERHHDDYFRLIDVRIVCRKCHRRIHGPGIAGFTNPSLGGHMTLVATELPKRGRKPICVDTVQKIVALRHAGWNLADIASAVGVGIGTVHKVLKEVIE